MSANNSLAAVERDLKPHLVSVDSVCVLRGAYTWLSQGYVTVSRRRLPLALFSLKKTNTLPNCHIRGLRAEKVTSLWPCLRWDFFLKSFPLYHQVFSASSSASGHKAQIAAGIFNLHVF